jgi:hypothetical protein
MSGVPTPNPIDHHHHDQLQHQQNDGLPNPIGISGVHNPIHHHHHQQQQQQQHGVEESIDPNSIPGPDPLNHHQQHHQQHKHNSLTTMKALEGGYHNERIDHVDHHGVNTILRHHYHTRLPSEQHHTTMDQQHQQPLQPPPLPPQYQQQHQQQANSQQQQQQPVANDGQKEDSESYPSINHTNSNIRNQFVVETSEQHPRHEDTDDEDNDNDPNNPRPLKKIRRRYDNNFKVRMFVCIVILF